jgi:hypothetical protein
MKAPLLFLSIVAGLISQTASAFAAQNTGIYISGGSFREQHNGQAVIWSNSPQTQFTIDNRGGNSSKEWRCKWLNIPAGSYLATPQGVVVATSKNGKTLEATLKAEVGETRQWTLNPNIQGNYKVALLDPYADEKKILLPTLSKKLKNSGVRFCLHLGHRKKTDLLGFEANLKRLPVPTYILRGPDEVYGDWKKNFGGLPVSFQVSQDRFLLVDNASGTLSLQQHQWLSRTLSTAQAQHARNIFVVLQRPLIDPRPGLNKGMTHKTEVRNLIQLFKRYGVRSVIAGHLPFFHRERRKGLDFIIAGGKYGYLQKPKKSPFIGVLEVENDKIDASVLY